MENSNLLIIAYIIIFTAFNFGVFLTLYLFGFTYDRDLRPISKRIMLPPFSRFFFYFRGIQSSARATPTKLCGICELAAFIYFIGMEILNVLISLIFKDMVLTCRISILLFLLCLIAMIPLTIVTKKKIKAAAWEQHVKNVEAYLTPKETIDITNGSVIDEFLSEPHEKPDSDINPLNLLDGKDFDEETSDVSDGMEAVNQVKNHIIVDNAEENKLVENILSAQISPEDVTDRETTDFREGMKRIDELRRNPIDNDL